MGTKLAPSYANLFMTKFEQNHVYTYHLQSTLWKRFIDDIFMIWPHGMDSLLEFHKTLEYCTPNYQIYKHYLPNRSSFSRPHNIH